MEKEQAFLKDLERLINGYSRENPSNTPDYILAQYLLGCLIAFETAVQQRETWYGRDASPLSPDAVFAIASDLPPFKPEYGKAEG